MKENKGTTIVKNINTSNIRKYFLENKPYTIKELMSLTGLSFPTINRIIDHMVSAKEIYEVGLEESTGGRRAKTYLINPNYTHTLSMYLSENKLIYQLSNCLGEVVIKGEKIKNSSSYIHFMDQLIEELMENNASIKAIAIGVPGSVCDGVIQYIDTYDELKNYPLKLYLEKKWKVAVCVENDMRSLVLGRYHAMKIKKGSVVCLYMGHNGPGCGMMVNGMVMKGETQFAGEIGFLPAQNNQNLQTIALKNQAYMVNPDYLARIIASLVVIINPKNIIIYHHDKLPSTQALIKATNVYVPEMEIPQLMVSQDYQTDYLLGLHCLAYKLLVPIYDLNEN